MFLNLLLNFERVIKIIVDTYIGGNRTGVHRTLTNGASNLYYNINNIATAQPLTLWGEWEREGWRETTGGGGEKERRGGKKGKKKTGGEKGKGREGEEKGEEKGFVLKPSPP